MVFGFVALQASSISYRGKKSSFDAANHSLQSDPFDSLRSLRAAELGR